MHSARDGMSTGTGIVIGIGMAGSGAGLTDAVRTGMAAAIVATASCNFSTVECREVYGDMIRTEAHGWIMHIRGRTKMKTRRFSFKILNTMHILLKTVAIKRE